jgi:LuxR family transcriptional regulator, maltose regulon positive regulatory protein
MPAVPGMVVPRRGLFTRLDEAERVVLVSALAGSGKTTVMRSWIAERGLARSSAWVTADRQDRDARTFWVGVDSALRVAAPSLALARPLDSPPDLDGWAIIQRLLTDLAPLKNRLWLVIDDVHELGPEELRQLELLIIRAPAELRFMLSTRHDVRLGQHRLRLEGELTEIREPDLRFTPGEARDLFDAAGVALSELALESLVERTEGWAAGLRLAALSLAGHPDPERFAAEFTGSERTVAEYLLAEVLDRQPGSVRRLLLRTSVLERVNGELADLLTGDTGGERALQDLEQAAAFTASLDVTRTWFRYHPMFAGLLALELRRTAPEDVAGLHRSAAGWFAAHGYPVEAVRHAQSAQDWDLAARLLVGHWPALYLDGQHAAIHELLAGFPVGAAAADPELAAVAAADELAHGSLEAAERYMELAEQAGPPAPDTPHGQAQLLLGIVRLLAARQRGNPATEAEEALRLRASVPGSAPPGLGEEFRALALISLGYAQGRAENMEQGISLARRIGRPYLEFTGLAYQAAIESSRSLRRAGELSRQAIELAERHGWTHESAAGIADMVLGTTLAWQGRTAEAEPWVRRAEHTIRAEADPAAALAVQHTRGVLELARGQDREALAALRAAERLARLLTEPHLLASRTRALLILALVRLGETQRAADILARLDEREREHGELHTAAAMLRLAQDNPRAAAEALAPVLNGSVSRKPSLAFLILAFTLEASAREASGNPGAAGRALEHALDLAEPGGVLAPFLLRPEPALIERHTRFRTAHTALITEIQSLPAGGTRVPSPGQGALPDALTDSELRVLRYLPTNLSVPEIARNLQVSANTAKTHVKHVYVKLGTHRRADAVTRARTLGLLAPSPSRAAYRDIERTPPGPRLGCLPLVAGPSGHDGGIVSIRPDTRERG